MEATSDMANSPTSASSASSGRAELAAESHAKATAALAEAGGETGDLKRVADYIFTRDE